MAKANLFLIQTLHRAAQKIAKNTSYQWGHMGSCNCGHLAQEITHLSKGDIHAHAMRKSGDWSEQSEEYCPQSGYPMDLMISQMLDAGLDIEDFKNLEKLSDHHVIKALGKEGTNLSYNKRDDVVKYMMAWATLLEEELVASIKLPELAGLESVAT